MTRTEDPCRLPTLVLAARLREKHFSALEVTDAHLERIGVRNPALNAVVSLDAEGARKRAREADAALARGEISGPLHGVPVTLKDVHDVAGLRTTVGAPELDRKADTDGTVAARLRAAGAIFLGHTNVPPWLADHQTANSLFGRTNNPWDLARTPGGSSGGAAAAVAAGLTPFEVASDLVGSGRLPAHFCGVYGLKTTEHRVPFTGFLRTPWGGPRSVRILSTLGPLARDLGDLELVLGLIAGPDGDDSDVPPVPLAKEPRRSVKGLRLALAPTLPGTTVSAALQRQVERVGDEAARAGAHAETRLPRLDWAAQGELFGQLLGTITRLYEPGADLRPEQRTLATYFEALHARDAFIATWEAFFKDFDAIVVPPAMTVAFPHHGPGTPFDVDGKEVDYGGHGMLHVFSNLAGLPALAAPAAIENGLPVGVQLVGPRWSEARLLEITRSLEAAGILPGCQWPPGY